MRRALGVGWSKVHTRRTHRLWQVRFKSHLGQILVWEICQFTCLRSRVFFGFLHHHTTDRLSISEKMLIGAYISNILFSVWKFNDVFADFFTLRHLHVWERVHVFYLEDIYRLTFCYLNNCHTFLIILFLEVTITSRSEQNETKIRICNISKFKRIWKITWL